MNRMASFVFRLLRTTALSTGGLAAVLGLVYGGLMLRRPARTAEARSPFKGIQYERYARQSPRPLMFHVVTIDLTEPGIGFLVTPPEIDPEGKETLADTVPGFLEKHGVQLAVNGSFFSPMYVHTPINYAPHVGEGINIVGTSISNGTTYSEPSLGWGALCITSAEVLSIEASGTCPDGTLQGIAGSHLFVKGGQVASDPNFEAFSADQDEFFPRTVVALDKSKKTLWLVVVDGRQWKYSEGIKLAELGEVLVELGADQALNFDGGGSTTLAMEVDRRAKVFNSPYQARVPTNLRPVANHLGVYAQPNE